MDASEHVFAAALARPGNLAHALPVREIDMCRAVPCPDARDEVRQGGYFPVDRAGSLLDDVTKDLLRGFREA